MLILVRPGMIPYLPDEILAVRSYVACGGSLLVVVSPGWEPAQPGIVDSLLAPFGLSTDREMVERAESTRIVPHPITQGVTNAMAKNPVNLKVPGRRCPDPGRRSHRTCRHALRSWPDRRGFAGPVVPAESKHDGGPVPLGRPPLDVRNSRGRNCLWRPGMPFSFLCSRT